MVFEAAPESLVSDRLSVAGCYSNDRMWKCEDSFVNSKHIAPNLQQNRQRRQTDIPAPLSQLTQFFNSNLK